MGICLEADNVAGESNEQSERDANEDRSKDRKTSIKRVNPIDPH